MGQTTTGIPRDCLRAHIRRVLIERIVDGTYPPGHRFVELQIAGEFGTSQGPVREALRELEALRLVESETYRGTRVRTISDEELIETAHVQGVLEQDAAIAAARHFRGDAGPLRAIAAALVRAAAEGDFIAYARQNMAFHRAIVAAAGNAAMLRVWDSLALEIRSRIGLARLPLDLPAIAASHGPIVDALEAGDGPLAGRLLRTHLTACDPDAPPPPPSGAVDPPPPAG